MVPDKLKELNPMEEHQLAYDSVTERQRKIRLLISMIWGTLFGGLTFAVGSIASLSANMIVAAMQIVIMFLLLPGIIGAGAISGNIHAYSLGSGAIINALVNFGLCWLLFPFVCWLLFPLLTGFRRAAKRNRD